MYRSFETEGHHLAGCFPVHSVHFCLKEQRSDLKFDDFWYWIVIPYTGDDLDLLHKAKSRGISCQACHCPHALHPCVSQCPFWVSQKCQLGRLVLKHTSPYSDWEENQSAAEFLTALSGVGVVVLVVLVVPVALVVDVVVSVDAWFSARQDQAIHLSQLVSPRFEGFEDPKVRWPFWKDMGLYPTQLDYDHHYIPFNIASSRPPSILR